MAGSLREALENAVSEQEAAIAETPTTAAPIDKVDDAVIQQSADVGAVNNAATVAEDKAKADRARDEQGRFAKEEKEKKDAARLPQKPVAAVPVPPQAPAPQAPQGPAPVADGAKYPTTWKKGLETQFASLPPEIKAEIQRREGNYATGVSTYKQEWDRAKPLIDVIAPYQQLLQQHNIQPAAHVKTLLDIHHQLVTGSPQQKASMIANIIKGNNIPYEMLFTQGQDGKVYLNQNLAQAAPQQQAPPGIGPEDVKKMVAEQMSAAKSNQEIETFLSQTDKYPHAKEVAPTMAQLLEANLADDLPSAYDAALRLPQHSHFYEADQKQAREAAEKVAAEAKRKQAEAARRNAVSVRSSTPTSVSSAAGSKKSLREQIAENVDGLGSNRV